MMKISQYFGCEKPPIFGLYCGFLVVCIVGFYIVGIVSFLIVVEV